MLLVLYADQEMFGYDQTNQTSDLIIFTSFFENTSQKYATLVNTIFA